MDSKWLVVTNGLGEKHVILAHNLRRLNDGHKELKEVTLTDSFMPTDLRQKLEKLWTITMIEEVESPEVFFSSAERNRQCNDSSDNAKGSGSLALQGASSSVRC